MLEAGDAVGLADCMPAAAAVGRTSALSGLMLHGPHRSRSIRCTRIRPGGSKYVPKRTSPACFRWHVIS
jgi:hypothetical protein